MASMKTFQKQNRQIDSQIDHVEKNAQQKNFYRIDFSFLGFIINQITSMNGNENEFPFPLYFTFWFVDMFCCLLLMMVFEKEFEICTLISQRKRWHHHTLDTITFVWIFFSSPRCSLYFIFIQNSTTFDQFELFSSSSCFFFACLNKHHDDQHDDDDEKFPDFQIYVFQLYSEDDVDHHHLWWQLFFPNFSKKISYHQSIFVVSHLGLNENRMYLCTYVFVHMGNVFDI